MNSGFESWDKELFPQEPGKEMRIALGGMLILLAWKAFDKERSTKADGRAFAVKAVDMILMYAADGGFTKSAPLKDELRASQTYRLALVTLVKEAMACIDMPTQVAIMKRLQARELA